MPTNRHGIQILSDNESFPKSRAPYVSPERVALEDASFSIKRRRHNLALQSLEKFGEDTENLEARLLYGKIARETDNPSLAIEHYNYVKDNAKDEKTFLEGIFGLAVTKRLEGDFASVFEYLKGCELLIKQVPERAYKVLCFSADTYFINGEYQKAKEYIQLARADGQRKIPDLRLKKLEEKVNRALRQESEY